MEQVLQTNMLTKKYGKTVVVDGVSMHINKGDIYGFIGMNGAGKSTLMKIVCGLAAPTSGEITLFGSSELNKGRKRIGAAIEQPALYPGFTAYQNLLYYNKMLGIPGDDNVKELLQIVGLENTGKKKTKKFSLGMKQRLAIAIALLGNPDFLILDEPINGLDPSGIREIRELIVKLNQEKHITILISSHILGELSKIATKYGIIRQGKLVEEFTNQELEEHCKHCLKIVVNDVEKAAYVLTQVAGSTDFKVFGENTICIYDRVDAPAKVNEALVQNAVLVEHLAIEGQDLESYFVRLMGGIEK